LRQSMRVFLFLILSLGACVLLFCPECLAAEKMPPWRKPYNIIMLWINFGILVVLFLKFARKPLMAALRGIHDRIKEEIEGIKKQHREVKGHMDSEEARLAEIQQHLEEIRARIIEMGEKEKQKIIEQAKQAAEKMIEDARAYASFQMTRARKQLSDEMVDIAISKVEERLKKEISPEDNENLVNDFLENLGSAKMQLN
jgi:F-type H+-transporting ATPase subunit b